MEPAREAALRGLLEAIHDALNVPRPGHPVDDGAADRLLRDRARDVCVMCAILHGGALDNTAIQAAGHTLLDLTRAEPVTYQAVAS